MKKFSSRGFLLLSVIICEYFPAGAFSIIGDTFGTVGSDDTETILAAIFGKPPSEKKSQ